ncbi:glycosyltransferase family 1 protein [Piedraia hortae CBS 480.64]|uniref:UDP-N-acetylglucosamine transferase subunit ALG13 n=1 Tax=Piedraia hortae CBS 480.64 TaxID=1314780 RepID=A0A6A7C1D3_9PEZI|nr:glycosyltransferase family 1 protein [Piedraia hortae CBS 480.64]
MSSKTCFVTIGATAQFPALITAATSHQFLSALRDLSYSELMIQFGQEGEAPYDEEIEIYSVTIARLRVRGFNLDRSGMEKYMCTARDSGGAVISHAGAGTVLEALISRCPLIVVPNSALLDNHQVELAEALAEKGMLVHGSCEGLAGDLGRIEALGKKKQITWPPEDFGGGGLKGILDREMGLS